MNNHKAQTFQLNWGKFRINDSLYLEPMSNILVLINHYENYV